MCSFRDRRIGQSDQGSSDLTDLLTGISDEETIKRAKDIFARLLQFNFFRLIFSSLLLDLDVSSALDDPIVSQTLASIGKSTSEN